MGARPIRSAAASGPFVGVTSFYDIIGIHRLATYLPGEQVGVTGHGRQQQKEKRKRAKSNEIVTTIACGSVEKWVS
jgi:hypothetical protein